MMADLHIAYLVFFSGIFMTGFGSAYYHYAPGNETLIWDRLPMTIGFMGLVTIIVGEHISLPAAKRMLIPLLIIGAGSVAYWAVTEERGAGDLRPYAIVQFLPMLLIPLILLMYRSVYDNVDFLWFVIVLYALSKLFEYFDSAPQDLHSTPADKSLAAESHGRDFRKPPHDRRGSTLQKTRYSVPTARQ